MYGIKFILKSTIENSDAVFYEEMIITVDVDDVDIAFEKAEEHAKGYCVDHINVYGKKVSTEIHYMSDAFESYDEEDSVREVYSKHLNSDGKECSIEDMYPLRNIEFNGRWEDEE